jgi:hypothetical protein
LILGTVDTRHALDLAWILGVTLVLFPVPVALMRRRLLK